MNKYKNNTRAMKWNKERNFLLKILRVNSSTCKYGYCGLYMTHHCKKWVKILILVILVFIWFKRSMFWKIATFWKVIQPLRFQYLSFQQTQVGSKQWNIQLYWKRVYIDKFQERNLILCFLCSKLKCLATRYFESDTKFENSDTKLKNVKFNYIEA